MELITVYVSIGNSDDKLTQMSWAMFVESFREVMHEHANDVYGEWYSAPDSPFQNACIAIAVAPARVARLREQLTELRRQKRQDSVAWAVVPTTKFI